MKGDAEKVLAEIRERGLVPMRPDDDRRKPKMDAAQYAQFMHDHAKAGKRQNKRREFFNGTK